jgi:hypothetical protein
MPRNQKLTKLVGWPNNQSGHDRTGRVLVLFDDQSSMKIKTTGAAALSTGGKSKIRS